MEVGAGVCRLFLRVREVRRDGTREPGNLGSVCDHGGGDGAGK